MKSQNSFPFCAWLLLALLLTTVNSFSQTTYSQNATNILGPTLPATKSATTDTYATFKTDLANAWTNNSGGTLSFPTTVAGGTTVYRAIYGANINSGKRFQLTSTITMQDITTSPTSFGVSSAAHATASNVNTNDYTLNLALQDANTGLTLSGEVVKRVGFIFLSRATAAYPMDIQVTATFSDGSTNSALANVASASGTDNTFFGFTATGNNSITSIRLQSFVPGTTTPKADRMGWDDFSVITGPSTVVLAPSILNATPTAFAIASAANGIHFQALTYVSINPTNVSLSLNSVDVSSQLVFTGDPTNYSVAFTNLLPDQQYTMTINVTNVSGVATLTRSFNTATTPFTLYDSQGFVDDTKYPIGNLLAMTNGSVVITPNATEPSTILDAGAPQGKVLQRQNTGVNRADFISFAPVSGGTLYIEFDTFISTTSGRTLDFCLSPPGGSMASFLAWGDSTTSGKLAYFDNVAWQPLADLLTDWHHVKIINYLSGPSAGKFDVLINGTAIAQRLAWRNSPVGSAFNQIRIESASTGPLFAYSEIDNLVVTAGPEDSNAFPPPQISNLNFANYNVIKSTNGVQFNVLSGSAITATNVIVNIDGTNVAGDLVVTGPATNLLVSDSVLAAGPHTLSVVAFNASGSNTLTGTFFAVDGNSAYTLYDSGGFFSDALYPVGALQAITNNNCVWIPSVTVPGQIVNDGNAEGKFLRRAVDTTDQIDYLSIPALSSGVLTVDADIRVSTLDTRVLDFGPVQITGANTASFLGWGTTNGYFSYFNTTANAWLPLSQPGTNWHHYTTVNYLSGPYANSFDLSVDGTQIGTKLPFKNNATPIGRIRVGGIRGTTTVQNGDVDNLVVKIQTFVQPPNPVTISIVTHTNNVFYFSFTSQSNFTHVVEFKDSLSAGWNTFGTYPGDGTVKTISDSILNATTRFYRIRSY